MIDSTTPLYPETIPVPKIERTHQKRPRSISTLMESGRMRLRRAYDTEIHYIQATWHFTEDEFDRFKTWFEETLINGEVAFSMVTYDPSAIEGEVEEITWELLFAEGNYSFTSTDNLHAVSALLEVVSSSQQSIPDPHSPIPPIELWYDEEENENPDVCRHTIILNTSNLPDEPFSSTGYIIQIANSPSGPWYNHIFIFEPRATVKINNDWLGEAWFKIVIAQTGANVRRAINPLPSAIIPPHMSISDLEGSPNPLRGDGPFPYSYSLLENPMISNSDLYICPRVRYQYEQETLSWDKVPQIVTITGELAATHKWTRDRSNPTEDTIIPALGGHANNLAAYQTDFGHMIKGCSFLGECRSPITCYLVDQKIYQTPKNFLSGIAATQAGSCDEPRIDNIRVNWERDPDTGAFLTGLEAHEFETSNSCNGYAPSLLGSLINSTRASASPAGAPNLGIIFTRTAGIQSGGEILDMGSGDAGQHRVGFLWNKVSVSVWSFLDWVTVRDGIWNSSPVAFSNLNLTLEPIGSEFYLPGGTSWTGPNGTGDFLAFQAAANTLPIAAGAFAGNGTITIGFDFYVVLTAHDDFFSFVDPGYIPPFVPPPPTPYVPSVFIGEDMFDDSVIGISPFQGGTGWKSGAPWSIKSPRSYSGYDDFQDSDLDSEELIGGTGWAEESAWTKKTSFFDTGGHDFEESELGPIHPSLGPEGGIKWADVWRIKPAKAGGDDFELYTAGIVYDDATDTLVPLGGGQGLGSFWIIKAL